MFWTPTVAVEADVADFIVRLANLAQSEKFSAPVSWLKELSDRDSEKDADIL